MSQEQPKQKTLLEELQTLDGATELATTKGNFTKAQVIEIQVAINRLAQHLQSCEQPLAKEPFKGVKHNKSKGDA